MTETKVFSIVEEYNGLMENIYNHLKPFENENDLVELFQLDGSSYEGYWSYTVGDITLCYHADFRRFYDGMDIPPKCERLEAIIEECAKEIEEDTKDMDEDEASEYEEEYFSEQFGYATLKVMIKNIDKLSYPDEQEKYKEFDNVVQIVTSINDEYGRFIEDVDDEVLIGINKDSNMDEMLSDIKKHIDKKVDILEKYFRE